ncbi:hypothetical protein AV274_4975 [Blastocystis sp. ATCC 50177/Nand II]|uniref:Uncharacterized protein n=1 Tax=Blastocystis sp. subtype 1 (strain ATCC 50177 / NandII) TaxID=478820 RepID=A0A196S8C6_BLAHN|nr:hypothetical protein AV274_4975 [Blastocystis sp. ATCC 50177/Nand II]
MSNPYDGAIVGRLKLKGKALKKTKKTHKKKATAEEEGALSYIPVEELQTVPTNSETGTGRIYATGSVVYGRGTKFLKELSIGDLISIQHPSTFEIENRVVKMIASDTSLSISSPFSQDFSTEICFEYCKKQEDVLSPAELKEKQEKERNAEENAAFGIYQGAGGTEFTYKTRLNSAYGGWKTITKKTKRVLTREEMLDMRVKNKSDRHCM